MREGVSIIICCYNSSDRLPDTLYHIATQKQIENIAVELILVNNNSTDDTKTVGANEWGKYHTNIDFKIIDEPIPGLSAARERGVKSASFEFILFCDDDNWLCDTYIRRAFDLMNTKPLVGALGGKSIEVSDIEFPLWWDDNKGAYAVGKQAETSGDLSERFYLWGAGMVSRKSLLLKVFDPLFPLILSDRKGQEMVSGGDSEICMRILLLGFALYYDEQLVFKHYMAPNRISFEYYQNLRDSFVKSSIILNKYRAAIISFRLPNSQKLIRSFTNFNGLVLSTLGINRKHRAELLNHIALNLNLSCLTKDQDYKLIINYRNRFGNL